MADVRRGRGQLILVTGLLVAVAMIALVLLLNTAIFTENLASRGVEQDGREAVEYRQFLSTGVGDLVEAENEQEYGARGTLETAVGVGIDRVDNLTARRYAAGGTAAGIDAATLTLVDGTLVRQTEGTRAFRNESGDPDWRIATGVDGVRSFRMDVNDTQLTSTDESNAMADGAFTVEVAGGGDVWRAFVYQNGGDVAVATRPPGGPTEEVCAVTASRAAIDLTTGTLDDEACPGLRWAEGVSAPYDVSFADGENVTGTYELTVDTSLGSVEGSNIGSAPNSPYSVPAVYAVTFEATYTSPTLQYRTDVRVAPGEPE